MKTKEITSYLKSRRSGILLFCLLFVFEIGAFALYQLPVKAVLYPWGLTLGFGILFLLMDYRNSKRKAAAVCRLAEDPELLRHLPPPGSPEEKAYQAVLQQVHSQHSALLEKEHRDYDSMMEYYTLWVHQIKTPIASMRLRLQNEDSALSRDLLGDLGRIEQYVEMVLTYLRLDSESTDYLLREYDLDTIVKNVLKRQSGEFIRLRLRLDYHPLNCRVLTDEKWLSFVIGQILSNALKYTPSGMISVYTEDAHILCIRDTGIGITPDELPRIFERGYTGTQGRTDYRASGIGLYLCKRICDRLGHGIQVESEPGKGTLVRILFGVRELHFE